MSDLLLGKRALDETLFEDLEALLLSADVGVETMHYLLRGITEQVSRKELKDTRAVYQALRARILSIMQPCSRPLAIAPARPWVIMVVGVNGVGKTTTIAKLAARLKHAGHQVMLAAADTFRAAAIEQLKTWAGRLDTPVIAQHTGADAAAVVHDALNAAGARGSDVLIVDTAGRQHTQAGLMDELKKIKRVIAKANPAAPHEVLLVLDAGTGQNALSQLAHFGDAVGVTGLALTKLDGTAKGGILIAIARTTGLPIRYIGVGEGMDDLREFDADEYVDALLPEPNSDRK
ncbi:MAG TPA: signal recognition particle-docking protein FtsY [Albitalea sp.]|nr:signal recognition particle-docking protein FtsY [Albitalea sp.]